MKNLSLISKIRITALVIFFMIAVFSGVYLVYQKVVNPKAGSA